MRRKKGAIILPPLPRTAAEHLAAQTGTDAADWYPVPTGTWRYRTGYRYYNKLTGQYARKVVTPTEES